jgi:hypothetical protein
MKPQHVATLGTLFTLAACSVSTPTTPAAAPPTEQRQPLEQGLTLTPLSLRGPANEEVNVQVELAQTNAQRQRGLMARPHLPQGTGMLFLFDDEARRSFWMKNTLIPLDIAYFDAEGAFVSATTMTPCTKDPCPSYPSAGPARYALEVGKGELQRLGIGTGWILLPPEA